MTHLPSSHGRYTDPNSGGGFVVIIFFGIMVVWLLYEQGLAILALLGGAALAILSAIANVLVAIPFVLFGSIQVALQALAYAVQSDTWLSQLAWQQIAINVAFGIAVGVVIGLIRLHRRTKGGYGSLQPRLLEELVDSVGNPTAVTAASIGGTSLAMHVLVSIAISLVVAALGVTAPAQWFADYAGSGYGDSPIIYALVVASSGDGGFGGSGLGAWTLLILVIALVLLMIVVPVTVSLVMHFAAAILGGTAVSLSAVVGGAIGGAQSATGRTTGTGLVLALTRLWTGSVVRERVHKPEFDREFQKFRHNGRNEPAYYDAFENWAKTNNRELTLQNYEANVADYTMVVEQQPLIEAQKYNMTRPLLWFLRHFAEEESKFARFNTSLASNPTMRFSDGAPPLTDDRDSLLYPGWFRQSLITGIRTGLMTGAIYAFFVPLVSLLFAGF